MTCSRLPASTKARCRRTGRANLKNAASACSRVSCATMRATCFANTVRVALSTDIAAESAAEGLFAYCRAGFEPELAAELGERAAAAGLYGHARTQRGSGLVELLGVDGVAATKALPFASLIFARQKMRRLAHLRDIDPKDRITPIMDALAGGGRHGDLSVEHPDSDE